MNKRFVKTSLIFLGIVVVGVMVRLYVTDTELFVSTDSTQTANTLEVCNSGEFC